MHVVAADFNSDGKLDIAVSNSGSNTASILLGIGDGNFAQQSFATGLVPAGMAVGDLNGDGNQDLVVTNYNAGTVSALLGVGDGTFQPFTSTSIGSGTTPYSVALGDFNGDGTLDAAVAATGVHAVQALAGAGDGTFNLVWSSQTITGTALDVSVSDLDGDGYQDLATVDGQSGAIILRGHGDGTFSNGASAWQYTVGAVPVSISSADFNADGKQDLVSTSLSLGEASVLLYTGCL